MAHAETARERFELTLELFEFGVAMKAAQLRRQYPDLPAERIDELIDEWLAERPGAEHGDGPGVSAMYRFR